MHSRCLAFFPFKFGGGVGEGFFSSIFLWFPTFSHISRVNLVPLVPWTQKKSFYSSISRNLGTRLWVRAG
jgi:hypothetical protein